MCELQPASRPFYHAAIFTSLSFKPLGPTCPDAVLERVPAVHQDLLQGLGLVGQLQVEALHALQELVGVVEVQDFGGPVEGLLDVVGQDVHHLQQELDGGLLTVLGWQQV